MIDLTNTTDFPTICNLYENNYQMDGSVPCIYDADEIVFMTATSSTSGDKYIMLPPAAKFTGKVITVYNKAYSSVSISVKCAKSTDIISPVAYYSGGQALVSGNTGQSIGLNHNGWVKIMALSNGWFALANGSSSFT